VTTESNDTGLSSSAEQITALDAAEDLRRKKGDTDLKHMFAVVILAMSAAELIFVNVIFYAYLSHNMWVASSAVLNVWLGASAVQIFGIILVVTRHLFPTERGLLRKGK
jgi:hypothetical protein